MLIYVDARHAAAGRFRYEHRRAAGTACHFQQMGLVVKLEHARPAAALVGRRPAVLADVLARMFSA